MVTWGFKSQTMGRIPVHIKTVELSVYFLCGFFMPGPNFICFLTRRTSELLSQLFRTSGLSDKWVVGQVGFRTSELSDK